MKAEVVYEEENTQQNEEEKIQKTDTGLHCLILVANYHNISADYEQIKHSFAIDDDGMNTLQMLKASSELGLKSKKATIQLKRLYKLPLPAVLITKEGEYLVLAKAKDDQFLIFDPLIGKPSSLSTREMIELWSNDIILFSPKVKTGYTEEFGIKWFLPALWKHKKILAEVLLASLFIQLFGLVSPLITQVIIDKVLVHHGLSTLNVLAVGLLIIITFELILGISRTYVFTHTTSRVDITLSTKLFSHLFRLPYLILRTGELAQPLLEFEN